MDERTLETRAQIIVEADCGNDKVTAARHGISLRSLQRYRKESQENDALSRIVARKRELIEANWAEELPTAIRAGIDYIKTACMEAKNTDPLMVRAIVGAVKILTEVAITKDVIDARLTGFDRPERQADTAMAKAGCVSATGRAVESTRDTTTVS